ncbi:DNA polymerase delta subunit 4 isoform X2 [Fukomys damarensis]|uniref:DNA polymerase delta subunit 4 isoform X2 n=1 Tax=Fukomys damarensis TaxID=885580 RepID=UPI00054027EC|nr:DNA polymerase delta subunit 4 isoform X2 [Fukomys damarensis]
MVRKRLITDSYPVVKRREGPAGHSKGELAPELGEEPQIPSKEQAELELLRQFDLAWEYGPCTASGISIPFEVPPRPSSPGHSCSPPRALGKK